MTNGPTGQEPDPTLGPTEPAQTRRSSPASDSELTSDPGETMPIPPGVTGTPRIPGVEITEEIGRGGMGVVYRGRQDYLDRFVAIKVLSSQKRSLDFEARFQREAKLLAGLTHPHIVACYQAGTDEETGCYLVMEYVDGPDLKAWLREKGKLPPRAAVALCRDLASALAYAHERTIIHRDVKPENVLLLRNDRAAPDDPFPFRGKLADLGLARPTDKERSDMNITAHGRIMGTPATMAPEQIEDPDQVDFRADVYGLGCVLYHALTGKPAFSGKTVTATIAKKLSASPPDPAKLDPSIPAPIADLTRRMLARSAAERPQSYDELLAAFDAILGRSTTLPLAPRAARPRWLMPAAAAMVVGIVALVVVAMMERDGDVRTIEVREDDPIGRVELTATGDFPGGSTFEWRKLSVFDDVELEDADQRTAGFTIPNLLATTLFPFQVEIDIPKEGKVLQRVDVVVEARNDPPIARAGPDVKVRAGDEVLLSAAESSDPEGLGLRYGWTRIGGEVVQPRPSTGITAKFVAPPVAVPSMVVIELSVNDGVHTATDEVTVSVQPAEAPTAPGEPAADQPDVDPDRGQAAVAPRPKLAVDAGGAREARAGARIELAGSADWDGEGAVALVWRQVDGPPVELEPGSAGRASFTAPDVPAVLRFELTARAGGRAESSPVEVRVLANVAPVADLKAPAEVRPGAAVVLDASASRDEDGDELSFDWEQIEGPRVELDTTKPDRASFTAPDDETDLSFRVRVSDGARSSASEPTAVRVRRPNAPPRVTASGPKKLTEGAADTFRASVEDDGGATLRWRVARGDAEILGDGIGAEVRVLMPDCDVEGNDAEVVLVVEADDGELTDEDTISVDVRPSTDFLTRRPNQSEPLFSSTPGESISDWDQPIGEGDNSKFAALPDENIDGTQARFHTSLGAVSYGRLPRRDWVLTGEMTAWRFPGKKKGNPRGGISFMTVEGRAVDLTLTLEPLDAEPPRVVLECRRLQRDPATGEVRVTEAKPQVAWPYQKGLPFRATWKDGVLELQAGPVGGDPILVERFPFSHRPREITLLAEYGTYNFYSFRLETL